MHAPYRFVDGLAEDMLGYIFPRGNGIGVIGEPDAVDGPDRFGCGHSDDSEAASSQTGDIVGNGLVDVLDSREGAPEDVSVGRYVLPVGALSRNPQGQPSSIKCDFDTVFDRTGGCRVARAPGITSSFRRRGCRCRGDVETPDRNTRLARSRRNASGSTCLPTSAAPVNTLHEP
jgi:hypothetical protein